MLMSVDGYGEDEYGRFGWGALVVLRYAVSASIFPTRA